MSGVFGGSWFITNTIVISVVLLFAINLIFTQRIVRASHPNFGWHKGASLIFKFLYASIVGFIIMRKSRTHEPTGTFTDTPLISSDHMYNSLILHHRPCRLVDPAHPTKMLLRQRRVLRRSFAPRTYNHTKRRATMKQVISWVHGSHSRSLVTRL